MPLQETSGAASYDAFGGGTPFTPVYIENIFSCFLYTGNGSTQTITNGIDLSGKGGLVWIKDRAGTYSGQAHQLTDTVRGYNSQLSSNSTGSASSNTNYVSSFSSTGFVLGNSSSVNGTSTTWASWTFREQAKFFDVVTYTGNGTQGRSVSHNLGSAPGWMVVKRTDGVDNWRVYHRSLGGTKFMSLDTTAAAGTANTLWNDADPTSTVFYLGNDASVNGNGMSYVAYLFAHDAGGFGASGADNVISCGSFTGASQTVTLGYEPQWILYKDTVGAGTSWQIIDNMRDMSLTNSARLFPNSSGAEVTGSQWITPTATGFITGASFAANAFIYIAIRRGPMKTPTSGTSVFNPNTATGVQTSGFPIDLALGFKRDTGGPSFPYSYDRLRGGTQYLITSSTAAEAASTTLGFDSNTGLTYSFPANYISWFFRRAPGYFDEVCYTGTGSQRTVTHNLGVAPELVIYKARDFSASWNVYAQPITASNRLVLNSTDAQTAEGGSFWNGVAPTATNLTVVSNNGINGSGLKYVAYLFATVAGVSKVGSYTGTGTTQTIDCGFTAGSRFVMIKRTDSTGDWYVWDSARGIVAGNDPYLLLNSTAAEVTNTDYVDTANSGFEISSTAPAAINANGGSFIFFAVA